MNSLLQLLEYWRKNPLPLSGLLVIVAVMLYAPVVHHDFLIVDDSAYVTQNPNVTTGLTLSNAVWAFKDFNSFYWHPLTWMSHMLDCQLFGMNAGAHHLVNVALHAINVLLLFLLLHKATGATWRSFLLAAIFAVHPMNVENVAWVAERKSLLSTLFTLLTIAAYGWWIRWPNWKRYALILLSFSLALMSKSMAVTLPIILLLLDYWPLRRMDNVPPARRWNKLVLEKVPLLMVSAASSLITFFGQRSAGAVVTLSELPLYMRVENSIVSYVSYLAKLIWPANLAFFYPHPASKLSPGAHLPWDQLVASSAVLVGITAMVVHFRRVRYLVVGWFGFLITIFPVMGVVQAGLQGMADRFAYVPYLGLFITVVWGIHDLLELSSNTRLVPVVSAIAVCLLIAYTIAARRYLRCWNNGISVLERARTVAGAPDARIEIFLGDAYAFSGQPLQAVSHYRTGCQLVPMSDVCHYNLAQVLLQTGEFREALNEYQMARSVTQDSTLAALCEQRSLEALRRMGRY